MANDIAFEMATSAIRFGSGVTREIGMDLADRGLRRVLVVTDPKLAELAPVQTVLESLEEEKVEYELFARSRVEPTDGSFKEAIAFAQKGSYEAFVAVGGGSSLDTAKAANLYSTHPTEDFLDYVNPPLGKGKPIPGPLKPLIAIPTTAGTGSETTGVAVCDLEEKKAKTGISHRLLKPTLGLIDPENTRTQPPAVAAGAGLDVLTHAVESYTAIHYLSRPKPERPKLRPPYQGCNPISDIWVLRALELARDNLLRAVKDPSDDEARGNMILASTIAGVGFGNAGVHLPHAMAYPVAGKVRSFRPDGYDVDHPMVPHGMAVVLNAPAAFRFTVSACPERHLRAAEQLGADVSNAKADDAGKIIADTFIRYMQDLGIPNGLGAVGYTSEDIPMLVEGTLAQKRLRAVSPRPVGAEELAKVFEDAMRYW